MWVQSRQRRWEHNRDEMRVVWKDSPHMLCKTFTKSTQTFSFGPKTHNNKLNSCLFDVLMFIWHLMHYCTSLSHRELDKLRLSFTQAHICIWIHLEGSSIAASNLLCRAPQCERQATPSSFSLEHSCGNEYAWAAYREQSFLTIK